MGGRERDKKRKENRRIEETQKEKESGEENLRCKNEMRIEKLIETKGRKGKGQKRERK